MSNRIESEDVVAEIRRMADEIMCLKADADSEIHKLRNDLTVMTLKLESLQSLPRYSCTKRGLARDEEGTLIHRDLMVAAITFERPAQTST